MRPNALITGLVLAVVLAFSSGTFTHFIYPGPSSPSVQVAPTVQPYVSPCDRVREEALTEAKKRFSSPTQQLQVLHCGEETPRDCPDCYCGN